MTTRSAPALRADTAASNAALPPPITMMSHFSAGTGSLLGLDAREGEIILDHRLGHRRQALRDERLQLGAADGAPDRQAALVRVRAVFLVVHQPPIGGAQDLEPVGRNPRRSEQRQPDLAR